MHYISEKEITEPQIVLTLVEATSFLAVFEGFNRFTSLTTLGIVIFFKSFGRHVVVSQHGTSVTLLLSSLSLNFMSVMPNEVVHLFKCILSS